MHTIQFHDSLRSLFVYMIICDVWEQYFPLQKKTTFVICAVFTVCKHTVRKWCSLYRRIITIAKVQCSLIAMELLRLPSCHGISSERCRVSNVYVSPQNEDCWRKNGITVSVECSDSLVVCATNTNTVPLLRWSVVLWLQLMPTSPSHVYSRGTSSDAAARPPEPNGAGRTGKFADPPDLSDSSVWEWEEHPPSIPPPPGTPPHVSPGRWPLQETGESPAPSASEGQLHSRSRGLHGTSGSLPAGHQEESRECQHLRTSQRQVLKRKIQKRESYFIDDLYIFLICSGMCHNWNNYTYDAMLENF